MEDKAVLNEVIISPSDPARQLILEAIAKIPENYPSFEEHHEGFLREQTSWKSMPDSLLYVVESTLEVLKAPYTKPARKGQVKVLKSRRYDTKGLDSIAMKIIAGTHHSHRFDAVARRDLFINNDKPFGFEIIDTTRNQGENVIKIAFQHRKKSPFGTVYISEKSKGFVRLEAEYNGNFPLEFMSGSQRTSLLYETAYFKAEDSLFRFLKSDYETFFKKNGDTLILSSQFVATSHRRDSTKIPYLQQFQRSSSILEKEEVYDSAFWSSSNIVLPDAATEKLFNRGSPTRAYVLENKKLKLFRVLSKINLSYSLQLSPLKIRAYAVNYSNEALSITRSSSANSNQLSYALGGSLLYEVTPKFSIGYSAEDPINHRGVSSRDLMVMTDFNLNPKARPIRFSPTLKIGRQQINSLLGTYPTEASFEVKGTIFDSNKTEVFASQRNWRVQPGFRLEIEKSRRLSFFAGTSYTILLTSQKGLFFRETDAFFLTRKTQFLKNGSESLVIESPKNLLKNTVSIELGIIMKI